METIDIVCIVLSFLAILLTAITAIFSVLAYSKVVGLENSTHQVQYVPLDGEGKTGKELDKDISKALGIDEEESDYYGGGI